LPTAKYSLALWLEEVECRVFRLLELKEQSLLVTVAARDIAAVERNES
jgi:hypothetical protein